MKVCKTALALLIILTLSAAFLLSGCDSTGTPIPSFVPTAVPQPSETPTQSPSPSPSPTVTPEPDRPLSEDGEKLRAALEHIGFSGIELDKSYSVEELTVLFVRLLGFGDKALESNFQHPFIGVSDENNPYIGYAYATWLLSGLPVDTDIKDNMSEDLALGMLLRAMGYSDHSGGCDFTSEDVYPLSLQLGLTGDSTGHSMRGDDLSSMLWAALSAQNKDGTTFSNSLIERGLFTDEQFTEAAYLAKGEPIPSPSVKPTPTKKASSSSSSSAGQSSGGGASGGGSAGGSTGGGSSGGGASGGGSTGGGAVEDPGGGGAGGDNETPVVPFG